MRLFLGIDVGEEARGALGVAVEKLRRRAPDAKWVPAENLHATLVFLGRIDDEHVEALRRAVDEVASRHPAAELRLAGGGSFGTKKRPRVLFVALDGQVDLLARAQADLETAMQAFGYEPEKRPFHAHVTLARARDPRGDASLAACVEALGAVKPLPVSVREIVLYQSTLSRSGPRYEAFHRALLSGR
ncbi:MAG TPA: RNA 2',3'-cyclic phosphodiesterase [Myxococcaceae bacterium]|nr:RNA 2',3'-cyclic phosphodiesterase [Myxococcaceae bacterium]